MWTQSTETRRLAVSWRSRNIQFLPSYNDNVDVYVSAHAILEHIVAGKIVGRTDKCEGVFDGESR